MIEHAGKGGSQFAGYAKTLIEAYLRQSYPVAAMPLKLLSSRGECPLGGGVWPLIDGWQ
jgi:hypothetical protein